jgi:hypothetical protein
LERVIKTALLRIGKYIFDMPFDDSLLAPLPELRREQIGVMFHEIFFDALVAEQESA